MSSKKSKSSPTPVTPAVAKPAAKPTTKPAAPRATSTAASSSASSKVTKASAKSPPSMSGLDAAYRILQESREPMNVRDITERARAKGLWNPEGKTPSATLASAIGREIKTKGKHARFKKADRGLFATTASKK